MTTRNFLRIFTGVLLAITVFTASAAAERKYDPGATDTEIKMGNIVPYTGLFSEYGAIGRAEAAYFRMIKRSGRCQRSQDRLRERRFRLRYPQIG